LQKTIKKLQKNKGKKLQNLAWLSQKWHFQIRPLYGRGTRRCPKVHSSAIADALYKYGIAIIFLGAGRMKNASSATILVKKGEIKSRKIWQSIETRVQTYLTKTLF
jgi:hypothetical protein